MNLTSHSSTLAPFSLHRGIWISLIQQAFVIHQAQSIFFPVVRLKAVWPRHCKRDSVTHSSPPCHDMTGHLQNNYRLFTCQTLLAGGRGGFRLQFSAQWCVKCYSGEDLFWVFFSHHDSAGISQHGSENHRLCTRLFPFYSSLQSECRVSSNHHLLSKKMVMIGWKCNGPQWNCFQICSHGFSCGLKCFKSASVAFGAAVAAVRETCQGHSWGCQIDIMIGKWLSFKMVEGGKAVGRVRGCYVDV